MMPYRCSFSDQRIAVPGALLEGIPDLGLEEARQASWIPAKQDITENENRR